MVDNVDFTPGTGATGAADDIGGVYYPRVKIALGADGSATDGVGGAGSVSAAVQRVTLASDDPAVVAAQLIDDAVYVDDADFTDDTSKGMLAFGLYQSTPQSITDGDVGPLQLDSNGRALVGAVIPGTGAANIGKAEDAAHSSGDVGVMALAVRKDTSTTGIGADGDYTPLAVNSSGHLYTREAGLSKPLAGHYETVAASQTAQSLGATGATGDYLAGVLIVPATTSPGNVIILDNATSITIFAGGASSVSNLVPFFVPVGAYSVSGAWKITTGANVSAIGVGSFT